MFSDLSIGWKYWPLLVSQFLKTLSSAKSHSTWLRSPAPMKNFSSPRLSMSHEALSCAKVMFEIGLVVGPLDPRLRADRSDLLEPVVAQHVDVRRGTGLAARLDLEDRRAVGRLELDRPGRGV